MRTVVLNGIYFPTVDLLSTAALAIVLAYGGHLYFGHTLSLGTLFAFMLVCIGVIVLRHLEPDRTRPFRVPFVHGVGIAGAGLCLFVMKGLPTEAWIRFGVWLLIGLAIYVVYGQRHSKLARRIADPGPRT